MRRWIFISIILVLLLTTICYAYRIPKPTRIDKFDDAALIVINDALNKLWDLSNGRFNLNVLTSAPSRATKEGDIVVTNIGSVYKINIYVNGAWRSWTSD